MRQQRFLFHLFHCRTFSVKHLGDVQELLSHLEGSVQIANGVILKGDTVTVRHARVGPHWVCHETTLWYQLDKDCHYSQCHDPH